MEVTFPGIGLSLYVDRVAFHIFSVPIYWYGIIIAAGLALGVVMAMVCAKKLGESSDVPLDLAIYCGPVAVVFARLYYVVFRWENYEGNLMDIFNLRAGGIAIYGAVIGAVIAAYVYSRIKKFNPLKIFDIGAVGLITGQMIGRWGNFFNQEAFGDNTTLPWGMMSDNTISHLESIKRLGFDVNPQIPVHPTFLYESLWCLGVLIVLFVIVHHYSYNGQIFIAYAALYGLGRAWIEGLRTDSLMIGPMRVSQVLAVLCVAVFGFLYFYKLKNSNTRRV